MTQITIDVVTRRVTNLDTEMPIDYDKLVKYLKDYRIGSILNSVGSILNYNGKNESSSSNNFI